MSDQDCVHLGAGQHVVFDPPQPPQIVVVPIAGPRGADGQPGAGEVDLTAHINSPNPHPAYDDMHSLAYIYQNRIT